jgi:dihydropteroate synthase
MNESWQTGLGPVSLASPLFLGILNITPDSMSDGGRFLAPQAALAQAGQLVAEGAAVLDLGAESTRQGADPVGPEQEWARLEPVLAPLRAASPRLPLSLDTRHALTAVRGLRAGAAIINDVTGFQDPGMLRAVLDHDCGLIAMRSRVTAGALVMPAYDLPAPDQPEAAIRELAAVRDRLLSAGIAPERILLDPGFGFGTTFAGDLALWAALPALPAALAWPVERFCIGISRKRFLAWRAGTPALPPARRDALTAQAHREAMALGYRVFRTHGIALSLD